PRVQSPQTNGVIERFFGTLKYEQLYRGPINDGDALAVEVNRFRQIYNTIRPPKPSTTAPHATPTWPVARSHRKGTTPAGRGGVSGRRSRRWCPPTPWVCRTPRAPSECSPAGAAGRRGSHGRRDSRPTCPQDGRRPPVLPRGRQARRPRRPG